MIMKWRQMSLVVYTLSKTFSFSQISVPVENSKKQLTSSARTSRNLDIEHASQSGNILRSRIRKVMRRIRMVWQDPVSPLIMRTLSAKIPRLMFKLPMDYLSRSPQIIFWSHSNWLIIACMVVHG